MADNDADKKRDRVLARMLSTPPKPHKPAKADEISFQPRQPFELEADQVTGRVLVQDGKQE